MVSKKLKKKNSIKGVDFFHFDSSEFTKENLIESVFIRPAIQMGAFISFIIAMFLLLINNLKWGGSLILFSFVLNMDSIYKSLCDKPSIYRTMNLAFKLVLFLAEIIAFNYVLIYIL